MNMRNTVCKILAVVLMISACDKPYQMDLPLSVAGRKISLTKDAGSTHVLVYSTGEWTARFEKEVKWASLDRTSGDGNGEVVLTYGANYGIARRVGIVLESKGLRDTVSLIQAGPVISPSFRFTDSAVPALRCGGTLHVRATSNLLYGADALVTRAIYTLADGSRDTVLVNGTDTDPDHWILSAQPSWDGLDFTLAVNPETVARSAQILMNIDDPTGRNLKSLLTVNQGTDTPKFALRALTGTYEKEAAAVLVETTSNNIYAYPVEFTLPETCDWIKNIYLDSKGLNFSLEENTGAMRSARISIYFMDDDGREVKSSFTVMQK